MTEIEELKKRIAALEAEVARLKAMPPTQYHYYYGAPTYALQPYYPQPWYPVTQGAGYQGNVAHLGGQAG